MKAKELRHPINSTIYPKIINAALLCSSEARGCAWREYASHKIPLSAALCFAARLPLYLFVDCNPPKKVKDQQDVKTLSILAVVARQHTGELELL